MAQVIVRNLADEIVQRLKQRARRRGRSLESELLAAAREEMADFRARAAAIRAPYQGTEQTDSALLLREDRDR